MHTGALRDIKSEASFILPLLPVNCIPCPEKKLPLDSCRIVGNFYSFVFCFLFQKVFIYSEVQNPKIYKPLGIILGFFAPLTLLVSRVWWKLIKVSCIHGVVISFHSNLLRTLNFYHGWLCLTLSDHAPPPLTKPCLTSFDIVGSKHWALARTEYMKKKAELFGWPNMRSIYILRKGGNIALKYRKIDSVTRLWIRNIRIYQNISVNLNFFIF